MVGLPTSSSKPGRTALPSSPNNRIAEAIRNSAFVISESNLEQLLQTKANVQIADLDNKLRLCAVCDVRSCRIVGCIWKEHSRRFAGATSMNASMNFIFPLLETRKT